MKKSIVTLAAFVALMPWLGFLEDWKKVFFTLSGLLIIALVLIPRMEKGASVKKKEDASFVESAPRPEQSKSADEG